MLKKYTAILFLSVACIILLGHDIIAHHHHATEQELAQHHQAEHHDDNQSSKDLNHILSHFFHSDNIFTFTTNHNIINSLFKQLPSLLALLPDNFLSDKLFTPPLLHKPPAEHFIYISPHSLSSGLRAPPAFIA